MAADSKGIHAVAHSTEFRRRRRLNWILAGTMYAFFYMARYNFAAMSALLADNFGWTNTELGYFSSVGALVYGLSVFLNGPLADRIGGRRAILIGAAGTAVFNVLFGLGEPLPRRPRGLGGRREGAARRAGGAARRPERRRDPRRPPRHLGIELLLPVVRRALDRQGQRPVVSPARARHLRRHLRRPHPPRPPARVRGRPLHRAGAPLGLGLLGPGRVRRRALRPLLPLRAATRPATPASASTRHRRRAATRRREAGPPRRRAAEGVRQRRDVDHRPRLDDDRLRPPQRRSTTGASKYFVQRPPADAQTALRLRPYSSRRAWGIAIAGHRRRLRVRHRPPTASSAAGARRSSPSGSSGRRSCCSARPPRSPRRRPMAAASAPSRASRSSSTAPTA